MSYAVASTLILGGAVAVIVIEWRRWTGRDRAWYERPLLFDAFMNDVLGSNPLARMLLAAGVGGTSLGLLIAYHNKWLALTIMSIAGFTGWAGIVVMLLRPNWAKPNWIKEVDRTRGHM